MVPKLPLRQYLVAALFPSAQFIPIAVEKGIEVVVLDDEQALVGMRAIKVREMPHDLQSQSRLARAFFAEHDRGSWLRRVAIDLVPARMIGAGDAVLLEHRIGLCVFFGERIRSNA